MSDENICRSCLSSKRSLKRLDSILANDLTITESLRTTLNIQVSEHDGLPFQICLVCLTELLEIQKFRKQYFESVARITGNLKADNRNAVSEIREEIDSNTELQVQDKGIRKPRETKEEIQELPDEIDEFEDDDDEDTNDATRREINPLSDPLGLEDDTDEESASTVNNFKTQTVDLACRKLIAKIFCLQCGEDFPTRNDLRSHFHSVHGDDNARGLCIRCQKIFPNRGKLMTHLVSHQSLQADFQCEICGRICLNQQSLDLHVLTHTRKRSHVCPICKKVYQHKSTLTTHLYKHTGKKFKCPKCNKKFGSRSMVSCHLRTHNNHDRPFICKLCKKTFRTLAHLKSHYVSHSDAREYACTMCNQAFKHKSTMRRHLTQHTVFYKCPDCDQKLGKFKHFRNHLETVHNNYSVEFDKYIVSKGD